MKITASGLQRLWAVASLTAIVLVVIFDLRIMTGPENLQVQYVPDDAYHYLTLSRNFAVMGIWTFDSGISTATGFHPLFAYSLSLLYQAVRPTIEGFVLCGLAFSSLLTLATSLIVWVLGLRQRKPYFLIFLTLVITTKNYTYDSISVTEWPLVVLFAATYVIFFYYARNLSPRNRAFILFITGLLGSLSRSDFGLLPLSLCIVSLVLGHFARNRRAILASLSGLAGAILGVLLIFAHNYIISGNLLQSSARMKAYWGQFYAISFWRPITLMSNLIVGQGFHSRGLVPLVALVLMMVAGLLVLRRAKKKGLPSGLRLHGVIHARFLELTLIVSAILCLVGYILVYALTGEALQPWYSANVIVPIFLILVIMINYFDRAILSDDRKLIEIWVSVIVLAIVARNIATTHFDLSKSPWRHQQMMLEAGKYLGRQKLNGTIASWNAGIIGYYQGGNVINIDGVVNDDVYDYAVRKRLPSYLTQKGVRYIIDYENMLLDERLRLRGGYDDEAFLNSLHPIKVFDNGEYGHMTLYGLSP